MPNYTYKNPEKTYTIDQFIACQSTDEPGYYNFTFKDDRFYDYINRYIRYTIYNTLWDYVDDIKREYFIYHAIMTDKELMRYKYRPKLLAFDVYGCSELGPMIMLMNDMYTPKQFTKHDLMLCSRQAMKILTQRLFNANQDAIMAYNS